MVEKRSVSCRTIAICARSDFLVICAQIAAIERDAPGSRIVESRDQTQERAFARAGSADQRDDLVRCDPQIDVVQNRLIGRITETDTSESDRARGFA